MTQDTIVITGVGAVTPLGLDLNSSWHALLASRVGFNFAPPHLDPLLDLYPVAMTAVDDAIAKEGFAPSDTRKLDAVTRSALAATSQALRDAGLGREGLGREHGGVSDTWGAATGVVIGLGYGASETYLTSVGRIAAGRIGRLSPFTLTASMPNASAANIAIRYGLRGPSLTVSTACASGLDAVGTAMGLLRGGGIERVVTGGVDALCDDLGVGGMAAARALAKASPPDPIVLRPFDRNRRGTAVGSGSAVFVLETARSAAARGARVLAVLAGYGSTCDAHHISSPQPEGEGAEEAMRRALESARLTAGNLDAIFAHGTGTPLGDRQEGLAMRRLFGEVVPPMTSTKGQTGHAMGASGAINLAFAVQTLSEGILPATLGCIDPDPECCVAPVIGQPHRASFSNCMINAFGFGGHNASIIVRAPSAIRS